MSAWKRTIVQCAWMFVASMAFRYVGLIDEGDVTQFMLGMAGLAALHATNATPDRKDK